MSNYYAGQGKYVDKINTSFLKRLMRRKFCKQTWLCLRERLAFSDVVDKRFVINEGTICKILGPVSFLQKWSAFLKTNKQTKSPVMGGLFCLLQVFSFFLLEEAKINKCLHNSFLISLLCILQCKEQCLSCQLLGYQNTGRKAIKEIIWQTFLQCTKI